MSFRPIGFLLVVAVAVAGWVVTCGTWHMQRVAERWTPLETRSFERLTVVTLGTGGAYENPHRLGPATAVALRERVLVVDAGRGVTATLRRARIPVAQPEAVLLTNLLPENTLGLGDLLATRWLDGAEAPLALYGPPGTAVLARSLELALAPGIAARAEALGLETGAAAFRVTEIGDAWAADFDELEVRAGALPGGPLAGLAYRFRGKGRTAVVAGSGWAPDALVEIARGAHLLVHEAAFVPDRQLAEQLGLDDEIERFERERALHTQLTDVGTLATRAGVETLALVRLRPPPAFDVQMTGPISDSFDGKVVIAEDGDELVP